MLETIIPIIDFWVWSFIPTILLLALLAGLPAALLVGALVLGKTDAAPQKPANTPAAQA